MTHLRYYCKIYICIYEGCSRWKKYLLNISFACKVVMWSLFLQLQASAHECLYMYFEVYSSRHLVYELWSTDVAATAREKETLATLLNPSRVYQSTASLGKSYCGTCLDWLEVCASLVFKLFVSEIIFLQVCGKNDWEVETQVALGDYKKRTKIFLVMWVGVSNSTEHRRLRTKDIDLE